MKFRVGDKLFLNDKVWINHPVIINIAESKNPKPYQVEINRYYDEWVNESELSWKKGVRQ